MSDRWFLVRDNRRHGPMPQAQLKRQVRPTDLVWRKGLASWTPATEVEGLFDEDEPPPIPSSEPSAQIIIPDSSLRNLQRVVMTDDGPVPVEDYSPTWDWIKHRMREMGLGYMLDTPEKRRRTARNVGIMVGLGSGTLGYRLLQRLGILP